MMEVFVFTELNKLYKRIIAFVGVCLTLKTEIDKLLNVKKMFDMPWPFL